MSMISRKSFDLQKLTFDNDWSAVSWAEACYWMELYEGGAGS